MLSGTNLKIGYEKKVIIENLNITIEKGQVLSIIGPNGCGKSTLLKTLSRMLTPVDGEVLIEKVPINNMKNKEISKKICLLSQHNTAPEDLTVEQLIYYGRLPHKKWYSRKNKEDEKIIDLAIEQTSLTTYRKRQIGALSGGEKQRVYIAQALCQQPEILLLDEPTTYLDICHQLELMELIEKINKKLNITVVMVLHDLNQASRYSDRIIVMNSGKIIADGSPNDVINRKIIEKIYKVNCDIDRDTISKKPRIHPTTTIKQ